MLKTELCDLFGVEYPIIQGGMAWPAIAESVASVSETSGLEIVGTGNAPSEFVEQPITSTRDIMSKTFDVNVMLLSPFAAQIMELVIWHNVGIVNIGAGNPGIHVPRLKEAVIKVMPEISNVALAQCLDHTGVDAIVAEGIETGRHISETNIEDIMAEADKMITNFSATQRGEK